MLQIFLDHLHQVKLSSPSFLLRHFICHSNNGHVFVLFKLYSSGLLLPVEYLVVPRILEERVAFVFRVTQTPTLNQIQSTWKWKQRVPSKGRNKLIILQVVGNPPRIPQNLWVCIIFITKLLLTLVFTLYRIMWPDTGSNCCNERYLITHNSLVAKTMLNWSTIKI
jgi:hypothetical protein